MRKGKFGKYWDIMLRHCRAVLAPPFGCGLKYYWPNDEGFDQWRIRVMNSGQGLGTSRRERES